MGTEKVQQAHSQQGSEENRKPSDQESKVVKKIKIKMPKKLWRPGRNGRGRCFVISYRRNLFPADGCQNRPTTTVVQYSSVMRVSSQRVEGQGVLVKEYIGGTTDRQATLCVLIFILPASVCACLSSCAELAFDLIAACGSAKCAAAASIHTSLHFTDLFRCRYRLLHVPTSEFDT